MRIYLNTGDPVERYFAILQDGIVMFSGKLPSVRKREEPKGQSALEAFGTGA